MDYRHCSAEELAQDPYFIAWVRNPSPDSQNFWERFQAQHPNQVATVRRARLLVLSLQYDQHRPSPDTQSEVWQRIETSLKRRKAPLTFSGYRIAAVAVGVLFLVGGLLWWLLPPDYLTETTAYAETREIILPDGSQVTLNANSRLRYASDWQAQPQREVWLEGEAFFAVEKDTLRFIVHTGSLNVQVLGTTFNVKSRHQTVDVFLQSGRVSLQPETPSAPPVIMEPGDYATLTTERRAIQLSKAQPHEQPTWQQGVISFKEENVGRIVRSLEDHYGIRISLDETLTERVLTATFPTQDLAVVTTSLATLLDATVTRQNDAIIIKPRINKQGSTQ